jgi:hypothetical protein
MNHNRYIEATYREGVLVAAYLYLARREGDFVARSTPSFDSMVADFAADGRLIGIELFAPSEITLDILNQLLVSLGQLPATERELLPLGVAA